MCVGVRLTAEVLQDEVELPPGLECIDEVHDEWVLHFLQNVPLCLGVGRVLGVTHYHGLRETRHSHQLQMTKTSLSDPDRLPLSSRVVG